MNADETNAALLNEYIRILGNLDSGAFAGMLGTDEDLYSGVYLPKMYDDYAQAEIRVVLVGQETAGWNTGDNSTMKRVVDAQEDEGRLRDLVQTEALPRYDDYYKELGVRKRRAGFRRFHKRVAKALQLAPQGVIMTNFWAWDYNARTPSWRHPQELAEVCRVSNELLAAQLCAFQPDHIVFATGRSFDHLVKHLARHHFGGYHEHEDNAEQHKIWRFSLADLAASCYRTSHPAYFRDISFRSKVIDLIKAEGPKTR